MRKVHEEGSIFLEVGVESSTKKTRAYPNELFHRRIKEIDSELRKHDTDLDEKFCGEYGSGEKQKDH